MSLLMLAVVFVAAGPTAQAQYRQYPEGRVRQERRDRRDRDGDGDYDRRDEAIRRQQEAQRRNNGYGTYGTYGTYGNNGRYGGYGNYGGYNQAAMNQGYQAGLNTGASDAQHGQSYSPQRSHYYRNASSQAFLQGFTQGYDQGYRQYAGYSNGRYRTGSGIGNILGGIFGRP